MSVVIARKLRIVAARVADAVMDGVVPIVIVIGVLPVPTAIMRLKRVMRPANTCIGAGNNNVLPSESQCPYLRRVGVNDAGFDCGRPVRLGRTFNGPGSRQIVVDTRIAFHSRHVRPGCQCLGDLAVTLH